MDVVTLQAANANAAQKLRPAVNLGYSPRILTNAQRLLITPLLNDIILTSDTVKFFIGDGITVGGIASTTGLNDVQAFRTGIIQPRSRNFLSSFRSATVGFRGLAVGNSIVQGSGASSAAEAWPSQVGSLLQAIAAVGLVNDWTMINRGVGGSQILVPINYTADDLSVAGIAAAPVVRTAGRFRYGAIMTMRNDTVTGPGTFNLRTRLLVRNMLKICEDVLIVSDPPKIDFGTGVPTDAGEWQVISEIMKEVATEYGCTYVDVWQKAMLEYQAGADLRLRTVDGTHPNDLGYNYIANLFVQALQAPTYREPAVYDRFDTQLLSNYSSSVIACTPNTFPSALAAISGGMSTATTARRVQLAEGSFLAYHLTLGQELRFDCPLPILAARPVVVQGNSASGTLSIDGVLLSGTFSASAGAQLEFPAGSYTVPGNTPGIITVTAANANTMRFLNMEFDVPEALDQHNIWPNAVESGTWGAATFTNVGSVNTVGVRTSLIVGDYTEITWYGTQLTFVIQTGTDKGKITEVTDGATGIVHDAYATAGSYLYRATVFGVAVGWHVTRFTVTAKNVLSSAEGAIIGFYKTCIPPDASIAYITVAAGEVMPLVGRWNTAIVDRVLTGAPFIDKWTPKPLVITIGGTGTAIVRLSK